MVHDDLPYRAMRELAGVLVEEVNEKLAERDARLDRLETIVCYHDRCIRLAKLDLYRVACEVLATNDDGLWWQFCEDHQLVEPEARRMVERWNRG